MIERSEIERAKLVANAIETLMGRRSVSTIELALAALPAEEFDWGELAMKVAHERPAALLVVLQAMPRNPLISWYNLGETFLKAAWAQDKRIEDREAMIGPVLEWVNNNARIHNPGLKIWNGWLLMAASKHSQLLHVVFQHLPASASVDWKLLLHKAALNCTWAVNVVEQQLHARGLLAKDVETLTP